MEQANYAALILGIVTRWDFIITVTILVVLSAVALRFWNKWIRKKAEDMYPALLMYLKETAANSPQAVVIAFHNLQHKYPEVSEKALKLCWERLIAEKKVLLTNNSYYFNKETTR
jgi:hypothetical protein